MATRHRLMSESAPGVQWVAFADDGATLVTVDHMGGTVRRWTAQPDGRLGSAPLNMLGRPSYGVAVDLRGGLLAGLKCDGGKDVGKFVLWDVAADREARAVPARLAGGRDFVALSDDARLLALADRNGVEVVSTASGTVALVVPAADDPCTALAFSPDGSLLLLGHDRGALTWIDLNTKQTRRVPGTGLGISSVAFAPDGRHVAVGDRRGRALIIPVPPEEGQPPVNIMGGNGWPVHCVRYSPDGRWLAIAYAQASAPWPLNPGGRVYVFATDTYEVHRTFAWFWGVTQSVAFSPDSRLLAVGTWAGDNGTLELWRVTD
jgi:WD40 repeat protein